MQITFKEVTEDSEKSGITHDILTDLPKWFGIPLAVEEYVNDVKKYAFIKVTLDKTPIGFVSIRFNNSYTAEIYLIGIKNKYHRKNIGEQLLNYAFDQLREENFSFVMVKTLDKSKESKEYEMTRLFYHKMGFVPLDVFPELWGKENPCLIMIKKL